MLGLVFLWRMERSGEDDLHAAWAAVEEQRHHVGCQLHPYYPLFNAMSSEKEMMLRWRLREENAFSAKRHFIREEGDAIEAANLQSGLAIESS